MKKLFILLGVAVMATTVYSQEIFAQDQHLKFKDIPIDGNISEFVEKMKSDGFEVDELLGEKVTMKGKFVNEDCNISVISTPKSNAVWKVVVYLPKQSSWYSLKSDYEAFVKSFTAKYGSPTKSYGFFSKPYYEGDGYEMTALNVGKCTYFTYWEILGGTIAVQINKLGEVTFQYEDKINGDKKSAEENDNILNDI